ncbi:MAG: hypothetical protein Q9201_003386 [Fulgogasparrea decipioides]
MLPPPTLDDLRHHLKRDTPAGPIILCTPGTETYIKLTSTASDTETEQHKIKETQDQIAQLVGNTWNFIDREQLPPKRGDGVIDKGEGWVYERTSTHGNFKLQVANAHHKVPVPRWGGHGTMKIVGNEVTWGVLRSALRALGVYMSKETNGWATCEFEIWDGMNQVGTARIIRLQ